MQNKEDVRATIYIIPQIEKELIQKAKELKAIKQNLFVNRCLFVISHILNLKIKYKKLYVAKGASIRSSYKTPTEARGSLRWYFGIPRKKTKSEIQQLIDWGIIELHSEYLIGVRSRTYKLAKQFENFPITTKELTIKDGNWVKKYSEMIRANDENPLVQATKDIYNNHISLLADVARELDLKYGNDESKVDVEDYPLWMLHKKKYYCSISDTNGRLFHNLTSLKKEDREKLLLDGKPLMSIDIINSQPSFSVPVIIDCLKTLHGKNYVYPTDLVSYIQACISGTLYEALATKSGYDISTDENRRHFKTKLFAEVFFARNNNWQTKVQNAFKELYPTAYAAITRMKAQDYRDFAIKLQKMESEIMINSVYAQLLAEGYKVLPLHDAFFMNNERVKGRAEYLINEVIQKRFRIKFSFKTERKTNIQEMVDDVLLGFESENEQNELTEFLMNTAA